jgi:cytochrome c oxidase cbb3-type subunit III
MTRSSSLRRASCAVSVVACLAFAGCEREARPFQNEVVPSVGGPAEQSPYQQNAWGISEGKRLYENFNCVGCHSHGGGGMGPPLMDDAWIYGYTPSNIFDSIVEGRPNGMPPFRDRIAPAQIWQLVAYVQSMSGQAPMAALPGRSDHMRSGTVESQRPAEQPVQTGRP